MREINAKLNKQHIFRSLVLPVGISLLDECLHTFLLVSGRKASLERSSFEHQAVGEALLVSLVHAFLGHSNGGSGLACDFASNS